MQIRIGCHRKDADYIRHARTKVLADLGVTPSPARVEPSPFATYLFAWSDDPETPLGMTETATNVESYYEDTSDPTACGLSRYCPPEQMGGMRTVYAEPEHRTQAALLALTRAAIGVFYERGIRFATASICRSARQLHRCYRKCGAEFAGCKLLDRVDVALYVFDIERLVRQRAMRRAVRSFDFELQAYCVLR